MNIPNIVIVIATILVVLGVCSAPNASEIKISTQCNVLPKELRDVAKKKGLSQVVDFYEIAEDVFSLPFVYGVDSRIRDRDSAAFWATKPYSGGYFLVVIIKDPNSEMNKCTSVIEWTKPIGGLSVVEDYSYSPSGGFQYVDSKGKKIPNMPKTSDAILSASDGIDALLFCYEGEWLYKIRH